MKTPSRSHIKFANQVDQMKIHSGHPCQPIPRTFNYSYHAFQITKEQWTWKRIQSLELKKKAKTVQHTRFGVMPRATAEAPIVYSKIRDQPTKQPWDQ